MTQKLDLNGMFDSEIVIQDAELVTGAILIVATRGMSDQGVYTRIMTRSNEGMDFITYRGMIELAHDECMSKSPMMTSPDDEDDDEPL